MSGTNARLISIRLRLLQLRPGHKCACSSSPLTSVLGSIGGTPSAPAPAHPDHLPDAGEAATPPPLLLVEPLAIPETWISLALGLDEDTRIWLLPVRILMEISRRFANLQSATTDWDEAMRGGESLACSRHRNTTGGDAGCFANKWINGLPLAA